VIARRKYSPEEWVRVIVEGDTLTQWAYLTRTGRHNLGLNVREFHEVLKKLEGQVKLGQPDNAYWRLRGEVESALRQERLETV
jgi:hypothetical protein